MGTIKRLIPTDFPERTNSLKESMASIRTRRAIRITISARFVLTPTQLTLETDTANRLDSLKHQLASTFGFSLHFKGETLTAPPHMLPNVDLLAATYVAPPVTVSAKEEHKLISMFLEKIYLDWAEQPSPTLKGKHHANIAERIKTRKRSPN